MEIDLIGGALFIESSSGWIGKTVKQPEQIFDQTSPSGSGSNKAQAYDELAKQLANKYIKEWSD